MAAPELTPGRVSSAASTDAAAPADTATPEVRWLTAREQKIWRDYLDVSRLLNEQLARQLSTDSDLSMAEYEILVQLSEHPERRMRMSDLAAAAVNSRSRLTHTIARMERAGYVVREPCSQDGRGVVAALTDTGMTAIKEAAPGHVEAVRAGIFDLLDDQQLIALGAALERLAQGLRAAPERCPTTGGRG